MDGSGDANKEEPDRRKIEQVATVYQRVRSLSAVLQQLGTRLDIEGVEEEGWRRVVRALYVVSALGDEPLVAITGEQGAGKTHLASNLCPAAAPWLKGNLDRGERLPIVIRESDRPDVRGVVTRRRRWDRTERKTDEEAGDGLTYDVHYRADTAHRIEQWRRVVRGDDPDVLLARLEVPKGSLRQRGSLGEDSDDGHCRGYVLLPGLEHIPQVEWQQLVQLVLATSPAALVVVDGSGLAGNMHEKIVPLLTDRQGRRVRFAVAISHCDLFRKTPEVITQSVERAVEIFGVASEDIVPIGGTRDYPEGWPVRLQDAVGRNSTDTRRGLRLLTDQLTAVVRNDVRRVVDTARNRLDVAALGSAGAALVEDCMREFDKAAGDLRERLAREVHGTFEKYYSRAEAELLEDLAGSGLREVMRKGWDFAQVNPGKSGVRLREAVDAAWNPGAAFKVQREVVEGVFNGLWDTYGEAFTVAWNSPAAADILALLRGQSVPSPVAGARDESGVPASGTPQAAIMDAIRALPCAALGTRMIALRLAEPGGGDAGGDKSLWGIRWDADDRTLDEKLQVLTKDHRRLMVGLQEMLSPWDVRLVRGPAGSANAQPAFSPVVRRLLVGAKEPASHDVPSPPRRPGSGTVTVATEAFTVGAVGAAVEEGGAAAGAALAPAAGVLAAAALTAVVLYQGNRMIRKRNDAAIARLTQWRTATEANILQSADDLLEITQTTLRRRLCAAQGVDAHLEGQFKLGRAIENVRAARELALEVLNDS
jgi:hypothetical protein